MAGTLRLLFVLMLLGRPAEAGQMRVSATGQWGQDSAASLQTGPGALFGFQFELPDAPRSGPLVGAHFVYSLGQINRPLSLTQLWLASAAEGGMFDMVLSDGATLSLFGPVIAPTGQLRAGQFSFIVTLGAQSGAGVANISAVPEPSPLAVLLSALLVLAELRRRRRMP
jgi:hypothetical protein